MTSLASTLKNLPISVGKVQLWLTYLGLKPLSSIVLNFDWGTNRQQEEVLFAWFQSAGLSFVISQRFLNTLHIAKESHFLAEYQQLELCETAEAHLLRGRLYGFPTAAVVAYAAQVVKPGPFFPNQVLQHPALAIELEAFDVYPYLEYILRKGHELEDMVIAKEWMHAVRRDVPELAEEYETHRRSDLLTLRKKWQNAVVPNL